MKIKYTFMLRTFIHGHVPNNSILINLPLFFHKKYTCISKPKGIISLLDTSKVHQTLKSKYLLHEYI